MSIDPSTPVVVGVGQVTNRPHPEGEGSLADRPEPLGLMLDAVGAAVEDCDGSPRGVRPRPDGPCWPGPGRSGSPTR